MELEITAAQKVPSSKKSIVLHPTDQGNAKVVLVKHYISPSGRKQQKLKPVHNVASKAYKRKSFELVGAKETEKQYATVKRRRSVQLGGCERTLKTLALVVQGVGKPQDCSLDIEDMCVSSSHMQRSNSSGINGLHAQSSFHRDDQQCGEWKNGYDHDKDTVLLPEEWLDKRYNDDLLDSDTLREFDKHQSLFSTSEKETSQVKSNGKCKSLFATYHLNKVHKSIIDEI